LRLQNAIVAPNPKRRRLHSGPAAFSPIAKQIYPTSRDTAAKWNRIAPSFQGDTHQAQLPHIKEQELALSLGFFTESATLAASVNASLTPLFFMAEHSDMVSKDIRKPASQRT
jgi:hypothetical protein